VFLNDEEAHQSSRTSRRRPQKKITPQRLRNIGLYYLKRFESSVENLRSVLHRRIDAYARENPQWDKQEAYVWTEAVLDDFIRLKYLDDDRFTEIKIKNYLNAGKPARYIKNKLRAKGIAESAVESILSEEDYDPCAMALKLAKRKKIGPYRTAETRHEFRQKDMGTLIRAGFDYDIVREVLDYEVTEE